MAFTIYGNLLLLRCHKFRNELNVGKSIYGKKGEIGQQTGFQFYDKYLICLILGPKYILLILYLENNVSPILFGFINIDEAIESDEEFLPLNLYILH